MKFVLLVEDDQTKARIITRWCQLYGVQVIHETTVADATRHILRINSQIGAVITDWQFPFTKGESPRDAAGEILVHQAKDRGLPHLVISGRAVPVQGYEPWIVGNDIGSLNQWLEQAVSACPALIG